MKAVIGPKHVLDQRIDELLKRFHKKAKFKDTKVTNCHGASAYVLGLTNKLRPFTPDDMALMMGRISEGKDRRFRALHIKKVRRGDLVMLDDSVYSGLYFIHTGIVTVPDDRNPTVFSKRGLYSCDESRLKKLMEEYPGTPSYMRIVRK